MDVHCANCREPWDHNHMYTDAIQETTLPTIVTDGWKGQLGPSPDMFRDALAAIGWEFGPSIFAILRCPCCDENERYRQEEWDEDQLSEEKKKAAIRREMTIELAELLAGDDDGLISDLNGYGDFERFMG